MEVRTRVLLKLRIDGCQAASGQLAGRVGRGASLVGARAGCGSLPKCSPSGLQTKDPRPSPNLQVSPPARPGQPSGQQQ